MSGIAQEMVCELLAQSLLTWRLKADVRAPEDGSLLITCNDIAIRVQPAAPDVPFRWMVTVDGRSRGAISLIAVLRQVRAALDPGYATSRVRIATQPLVPS